jgi:thiol-disulfide isomerase/thioredoxin
MKFLSAAFCFLCLATSVLAVGTHVKRELPLSIAQGAKVDLAEFTVPGSVTIFAFTSEYCAPCRDNNDPLYRLHRTRPKIAVVKVDINRAEVHKIDWQSPVAEQYAVHTLPYFIISGPDGKKVAEGDEARVLVERWIAESS